MLTLMNSVWLSIVSAMDVKPYVCFFLDYSNCMNELFLIFWDNIAAYERNQDSCRDELFHIESMGVTSSFRKRYCTINDDGDILYFPILTAIITVDESGVTDISWDDGCYFTDSSVSDSVQVCVPNAYSSNSTAAIDSVPEPAEGYDTALTSETCEGEPDGFCDLAVYVAWTGKDVNGRYMGSGGRRFSVYRDYDLQTQYDAMRLFLLNEK